MGSGVQINRGWQTKRPNNIIPVPTTLDTGFFRWWCIFLRPFVNLTNREIDVMSAFLKQRWELSKSISDEGILDTMVMSDDSKKKVMAECNITLQHFYVVFSNLRKSNAIIGEAPNYKINPKLIPNIRKEDDSKCFQLLILFHDDPKQHQSHEDVQ